MIQVQTITLNPGTMKAKVFLMSDTKAEMTNATTSDYKGFPEGYEVEFGSSVMTTAGEMAFMKSDGQWNWL